MTRIVLSLLLALFFATHSATAQDRSSWIQIETHPSLAVTQQAIRAYGAQIADVNGFSLGAGWYAVALGPYTPGEAEAVMVQLRAQGLIPRDSYVAASADFQQQFWPVGANFLAAPTLEVATEAADDTVQLAQAETGTPQVVAEPGIPEETAAEARQSEAQLSRAERAQLQEWLKWAGFYRGAVDAAIGPGTRASMQAWQAANGHEPTGILTTRQRAQLMRQFNAVLDGLGLRTVRDDETGIQMRLPLDVVAFDKYQPPFAHFNAKDGSDAKVLLISQPGDRNTMVALYDIMQTLRIIPEDGPREIKGDSFTITGRNSRIVSQTEVSLVNGEIKGFTVVWPASADDQRTRMLTDMRGSFTRIPGLLDPAVASDEEQRVDLVSGLEIRRPKLSRSGFYVDQSGTLVTTLEAVQGCERVTIDEDYSARVIAVDNSLGVAVLRPVDPLTPINVAAFQQVPPRLQSDVAVAGYSYGGVLGAPTLTFGQLADLRGLNGEEDLTRLALAALDGDAGGPVVDGFGAVVGMLLPAPQQGRQLPEGVSFAADAGAVRSVLEGAGIFPAAASGGTLIAPETLSKQASGMTVLVSCWD